MMRIEFSMLRSVAQWACTNKTLFHVNGFGRRYGALQKLSPPAEVWEIKRQIVEAHALHGVEQEPMFKDFCGFITEGGAIHAHTDPGHSGKQHVRFNVMVSKPEAGGMPVQDGIEMAIEAGDVWRCDASRVKHWCTPVVGCKPRIVLSFGFLI